MDAVSMHLALHIDRARRDALTSRRDTQLFIPQAIHTTRARAFLSPSNIVSHRNACVRKGGLPRTGVSVCMCVLIESSFIRFSVIAMLHRNCKCANSIVASFCGPVVVAAKLPSKRSRATKRKFYRLLFLAEKNTQRNFWFF